MHWIHVNVSVVYIPLLSFLTKEGKLNPEFWSLHTDLLDAARINATYVFSSFIGSCNPITGSYDGLIGDLGSNITDFSIEFQSYEAIADPRCEMPIAMNAIYRQQNSHMVSGTDTNVTKSMKRIHETLLVFDSNVTFFMSMIYVLSVIALKKSALINRTKSYIWILTKIWFHQDSNDDSIGIQSQKTILNTSKVTLVYFIILISAFINTDLVSYSSPKQIDSVDDAIESGIQITFVKELGTYSVLKAAEEGSNQHRLFAHALDQANKAGNNESMFIESKSGSSAHKIKERSLILISTDFTCSISDRTDCMGTTSGATNRFHKSRDTVLTEHESLFYSRRASAEIKARTRKVYTRAMEFGLFGKERQDAATRVTDTYFPGSIVSVSCLHRDRFQSGNNQDQRVRYEDFSYLIIRMASFYAICVCMLMIELISIRFVEPIRLERMQRKKHFEVARQRRKMRIREIDQIFFVPKARVDAAAVGERHH